MSRYQYHSTASMMDSARYNVTSGSPNSSEEIESHHGTPETKLSVFSPEEFRAQPKTSPYRVGRSSLPPPFTLGNAQVKPSPKLDLSKTTTFGCQDPFVASPNIIPTARNSDFPPKLSPTASSFTPLKFQQGSLSHGMVHTLNSHLHKASVQNGGSMLSAYPIYTMGPNISSAHLPLDKHPLTISDSSQTTSTSLSFPLSIEVVPPKIGVFSTDGVSSRSLMVTQVSRKASPREIEDFFSMDIFSSLQNLSLAELATAGAIYANFTDIRDAQKAYAKVKSVRVEWNIQYIAATNSELRSRLDDLNYVPLSLYEGQVIVKADFSGPRQQFNARTIGHLIKELLENYGEIMGYDTDFMKPPTATYRAEFFNSAATKSAISYLNGFKVGGCIMSIMRYKPQTYHSPSRNVKGQSPLIVGQTDAGFDKAFENMSLSNCQENYPNENFGLSMAPQFICPSSADQSLGYHGQYLTGQSLSPPEDYISAVTPRSSGPSSPWSSAHSRYSEYGLPSPCWARYTPGAIGQERGVQAFPQARAGHFLQQQRSLGKLSGRQNHDYVSGHHNVVDVDRIRQGTDVRTTIMLRNIPNKIDQAMLKEIVDETSLGRYDFMYLRIDFANNCNVGYAFINFEDPYYIIDFVNARAGYRWNRYNSDKVAEVSYATIQGRDCLIQKFRNSSVMLEHPSFRPKIFHVGNSPLSGSEDEFPGPDNPSKMRRSVENAEHVGLFAPRAGQNFRDEQRRRRSQYDRGTRLAEMEDAYDFDQPDFGNGTNHFYSAGPYPRQREYPLPRHGSH